MEQKQKLGSVSRLCLVTDYAFMSLKNIFPSNDGKEKDKWDL